MKIPKRWWILSWTRARPGTPYLGRRILKFLFQMGLEGGATFRRVIPLFPSGSGWCAQEWKVVGSKDPGLEWRLRCSVV